jgi:hypothetical protein
MGGIKRLEVHDSSHVTAISVANIPGPDDQASRRTGSASEGQRQNEGTAASSGSLTVGSRCALAAQATNAGGSLGVSLFFYGSSVLSLFLTMLGPSCFA